MAANEKTRATTNQKQRASASSNARGATGFVTGNMITPNIISNLSTTPVLQASQAAPTGTGDYGSTTPLSEAYTDFNAIPEKKLDVMQIIEKYWWLLLAVLFILNPPKFKK